MFYFEKEGALKAGASSFIDKSGYYTGKFTEVKIYEAKNSKVKMLNLTFEANTGASSFLTMCIINKKGEMVEFTKNMISALMGIFKIDDDGEDIMSRRLLNLENKKIMLGLQKEDDPKSKYDSKMHIVNFFEPVTKKTFTELYNNEPAETYKQTINDKTDNKRKSNNSEQTSQNENISWDAENVPPFLQN